MTWDTEAMIRDGRLFRCEVCGGVGDWVCDCPDGRPTTTRQDAERVARMTTGERMSLEERLLEAADKLKGAVETYYGFDLLFYVSELG